MGSLKCRWVQSPISYVQRRRQARPTQALRSIKITPHGTPQSAHRGNPPLAAPNCCMIHYQLGTTSGTVIHRFLHAHMHLSHPFSLSFLQSQHHYVICLDSGILIAICCTDCCFSNTIPSFLGSSLYFPSIFVSGHHHPPRWLPHLFPVFWYVASPSGLQTHLPLSTRSSCHPVTTHIILLVSVLPTDFFFITQLPISHLKKQAGCYQLSQQSWYVLSSFIKCFALLMLVFSLPTIPTPGICILGIAENCPCSGAISATPLW